jgi:hypothetical protein
MEASDMSEDAFLGKTSAGEELFLTYEQRRQHTYVIGVNGTGKTTLLRELAHSDMLREPKHGLCVIDPHGDLIEDVLALVPESRLDDVILFDPSDEENPFCLNVFAPVPEPEQIGRVASEIVAIFRKIFGGAWTPEIEGVLQNVTLTLLSRPADFELERGQKWVAAMDEIPALLAMERVEEADRANPPWKRRVQTYRSQFYRLLQERDQIPVWEFWNYNFDTLTPRPRSELTFAVLNQVRRFLANPTVRNIVAQTESKLDLSQVMNDGRILLVNLSKGLLGEANSAFLGSVLVAKLVVAVFARAKLRPPAERRPFHIIVDEFQNFAISSFPMLLSEARKYNVDLVIAHQYRDQLRDWVQGATVNAGNIVCFRLGGEDALELARDFDTSPPPAPLEKEPLYDKVRTRRSDAIRYLQGFKAPLLRWRDSDDWLSPEWVRSSDGRGMERNVESVLQDYSDQRLAFFLYWLSATALAPGKRPEPDELPDSGRRVAADCWVEAALVRKESKQWAEQAYNGLPEWARRRENRSAEVQRSNEKHCVEDFEDFRAWMVRHRPCDAVFESLGDVITGLRKEDAVDVHYVHRTNADGDMVYQDIPGRPRLYSDVGQQVANELTHLPNFHARCRLSGSDTAPLESTFRTRDWPEVASDEAERGARFEENKGRAKENTHRDFTRPKKDVEGEFKKRYETMLSSIGMSWTPGNPLPKPQVLLESEDD